MDLEVDSMVCASLCVDCVVVFAFCCAVCLSKKYAMRDSNPQPPDSKSDTLSIAPTAPPKQTLRHPQTTTQPLTHNTQHHITYHSIYPESTHQHTLQSPTNTLSTKYIIVCIHTTLHQTNPSCNITTSSHALDDSVQIMHSCIILSV